MAAHPTVLLQVIGFAVVVVLSNCILRGHATTTTVDPSHDLSGGDDDEGLTFRIYDNAALHGSPIQSGVIPSAKISLQSNDNHRSSSIALSGELLGTINFPQGQPTYYHFDCHFSHTSTGWVWVDGHLVCDDGHVFHPYNDEYDNPLLIRTTNKSLPFRAHIATNRTTTTTTNAREAAVPSLQVRWRWSTNGNDVSPSQLLQVQSNPIVTNNNNNNNESSTTLYAPRLHPHLSSAEQQRDGMQRQLTGGDGGWGSWLVEDLQSLVKLPEGAVLTTRVCQRSTNSCLTRAIPDDNSARVGLHAHDRSYVGFHMAFQALNVSVQYTVDDTSRYPLQLLATPVSCSSSRRSNSGNTDCSNYELRISGRYAWFRLGSVRALESGVLAFTTPGLGAFQVTVVEQTSYLQVNSDSNVRAEKRRLSGRVEQNGDETVLRIPFGSSGSSIGLYTTKDHANSRQSNTNLYDEDVPTISSIQKLLEQKQQQELSRLQSTFGKDKAPVAQAIQAAVMWTLIYNPVENNAAFLPVSRAWSFAKRSGAANLDWAYVIFGTLDKALTEPVGVVLA